MREYPYSTPKIMSDTVFEEYGGNKGESTLKQRNAVYFIAEKQMSEHINTFLVPTIVTGTYFYTGHPIVTEWGHVNRIIHTSLTSVDFGNSCELDVDTGCAVIRNDKYGYVDVAYAITACGCNYDASVPYQVQLVYEAGLPTGTSMQSDMLFALTLAAQINLNEIDHNTMSNESVGDVGVQSFSSLDYTEQRVKLGRNAFGTSALAQKIVNLVKGYICRAGLRFH